MNRFFVEGRHAAGDTVPLDGSDAHKIVAVLRKRDGDTVEIIDSAAQRFVARLAIDGRAVSATLLEARAESQMQALHLTIAQGVPKGQKMDFVVEKLTELGVSEIVPLISERTVAQAGENKIDRWRRLAKSAAQQCGRANIPQIADALTFDELMKRFPQYDLVLFPWELAERVSLRERLPKLAAGASRILAVIGPEGGFSHGEAEAARAAGAELISLGSRILRTETAGLVLAALLAYLSEP